jgi:nucleotide-binding universal stress UspA family protein
MLRTILIPLDDSVLAEQALIYAADLSRRTGASLLLVRAAISHTLPGVDARERKSGAIAEAELYLTRTAASLTASGLACKTVVPYGHPAASIVETARLTGADLIVMSTHGRTGPGRLVFGSVAQAVVAESPVPVLVARAWLPPHRQPFLPEQPTLVVPLDGSEFAESALSPALALAENLGATLILLRADGEGQPYNESWEYISSVRSRLHTESPMVEVAAEVRTGEPSFAIDAAVAERNASMVVMATHGRGGVLRSVTGSVAGKVLNGGRAPVVLVRPAVRAASEPPLTATELVPTST